MALRPIPNLDNAEAMAKLGRLSAIRSARMDALSQMREAFGEIQNDSTVDSGLKKAREALDRLERLQELG